MGKTLTFLLPCQEIRCVNAGEAIVTELPIWCIVKIIEQGTHNKVDCASYLFEGGSILTVE